MEINLGRIIDASRRIFKGKPAGPGIGPKTEDGRIEENAKPFEIKTGGQNKPDHLRLRHTQ